jgi:hypothetical protein
MNLKKVLVTGLAALCTVALLLPESRAQSEIKKGSWEKIKVHGKSRVDLKYVTRKMELHRQEDSCNLLSSLLYSTIRRQSVSAAWVKVQFTSKASCTDMSCLRCPKGD